MNYGELKSALRYESHPVFYTALFISIALLLRLSAMFSQPADPMYGLDWRFYLALGLMEEIGVDSSAALRYRSIDQGLAKLSDEKSAPDERSAAALGISILAYRRRDEPGGALDRVADAFERLLDKGRAPGKVLCACCHCIAILRADGADKTLLGLYRSTSDRTVKVHCLMALRSMGRSGLAATRTIRAGNSGGDEPMPDAARLDAMMNRAYRRFVARHRLRMALADAQARRRRFLLLPVVTLVGATGVTWPPILLLLPLAAFTVLSPTVCAWLLLLFVTLTKVARRATYRAIIALGCSVVVMSCIDSLAAVFDLSLFGVFVLWNVDAFIRPQQEDDGSSSSGAGRSDEPFAGSGGEVDSGKGQDSGEESGYSGGGTGASRRWSDILDGFENDPARAGERVASLSAGEREEFGRWLVEFDEALDGGDRRIGAVTGLMGLLSCRRSYERLKSRLLDDSLPARKAALAALSRRERSPELLSIFSSMTYESDIELKLQAMHAVAEYGFDAAEPVLRRLVEDGDERISSSARLVLEGLRDGR